MRYVPDLIPENAKVLPDYFKGNIYEPKGENTPLVILSYIGMSVCFFLAFTFIKHPLLFILFGVLGFVIFPYGHLWLERYFRFQLTTKIKSVLCAVLFVFSIPLIIQYKKIDQKEIQLQKVIEAKAKQNKIEADQKEKARIDSLNYYTQEGLMLAKSNKQKEGLKKLEYALSLATTENEKKEIQKDKLSILVPPIKNIMSVGNYQIATNKLTELILQDPYNSELLYNRAICYSKIGKIKEAVKDLKISIELGNADAVKLHDNINPIRKHIIGYVNQCCDGTTSSSSGQGACSHHGGVCGSKPIFDEGERKFN